MKHKPTPDPPHILDYIARIKVEGINIRNSPCSDRVHVIRQSMNMGSATA